MKLSEAIRMGSQWADCHGPVAPTGSGSCCAIGGVIKAIGKEGEILTNDGECFSSIGLARFFPMLRGYVNYPESIGEDDEDGKGDALWGVIVTLFEKYGWSKKAIAEWVETIENKLETESRQSSRLNDTEAVQAAAPVSGETVKV